MNSPRELRDLADIMERTREQSKFDDRRVVLIFGQVPAVIAALRELADKKEQAA